MSGGKRLFEGPEIHKLPNETTQVKEEEDMKPKVFVTRQIPEAGLKVLREKTELELWPHGDVAVPREVLEERMPHIQGMLALLSDRIDEHLIARGSHLKVITNYAVGTDNIDVRFATSRGVTVTNTPDVLTDATADLTFALMLGVARKMVEGNRVARSGRWIWAPDLLAGEDVFGATLGIVGFGRIGRAVARRAQGFSMRLLVAARDSAARDAAELGAQLVPLEELLAESDYVTLHCPLTTETAGMMNEDAFRRMKKNAIFINTGRGKLVDQQALGRALSEWWIAGAGLDVFDPEPLPPDHPLFAAPNLLPLPHLGSATRRTRERMAVMAAEDLVAVLEGKIPCYPVRA